MKKGGRGTFPQCLLTKCRMAKARGDAYGGGKRTQGFYRTSSAGRAALEMEKEKGI